MSESSFLGGGRLSSGAGSLTSRTRVFIVDDHPIARRGMADLIGEQGDMEVCGQAGGADEALRQVKQTRPSVVIVDLALNSGHGMELIEEISQWNHHVKTLVVSAFDEEMYAERCLRAGALGYVNKEEAPEKLVEAVRKVLRSEIYLSGGMANRILHTMVGGQPVSEDPIKKLSNREMEVFQMIGQGMAGKEIADRLHLSPKTVDTHRENLKTKLNIHSSHELTRYAMQWSLENQ